MNENSGNPTNDSNIGEWITDTESANSNDPPNSFFEQDSTFGFFSDNEDYEFFDLDQHLQLMNQNYMPKETFIKFRNDYIEFLKQKEQEYNIPIPTLSKFIDDFDELKQEIDNEIVEFTDPENTEYLACVLKELSTDVGIIDTLNFDGRSILPRHLPLLTKAIKSKNINDLTFFQFLPPTDTFFQIFADSTIQYVRIDTKYFTKPQLLDFVTIIPRISTIEFSSYHDEFNDVIRIPPNIQKLYLEDINMNDIGNILGNLGNLKILSLRDVVLNDADLEKLKDYLSKAECDTFIYTSQNITAPPIFQDILKTVKSPSVEISFKEIPYLPALSYNMHVERLTVVYSSFNREHIQELVDTSRSIYELSIFRSPLNEFDELIKDNCRLRTVKLEGSLIRNDKLADNNKRHQQNLKDVFLASKTMALLDLPIEITNMIFQIFMLQNGIGVQYLQKLSRNLFGGKVFDGKFCLETLVK
ncbi:hypothetical protein HDV01_001611 [Terramyces sp. JEL0728]|nr:hypothetical protein HDV01_001611 [Terramyces sp. JEL0728]